MPSLLWDALPQVPVPTLGVGRQEQGVIDLEDKGEGGPQGTPGPGAVGHGSLLSLGCCVVWEGPLCTKSQGLRGQERNTIGMIFLVYPSIHTT